MQGLADIKVVSLGGGTGLSTLLSGLKHISLHSPLRLDGHGLTLKNIVAVVTVSDDGGSSGRIRDHFPTPAPGDIRSCLVALASDEMLMTKLFRYRFSGEGELHNHSLGNLLLTALTDITGDFAHAVRLSTQVLAVEGRILPSTTENITLRAVLADGREISGETQISKCGVPIERVTLDPASCQPLSETLEAIADADVITLGPGSLFTSLIPNLLVPGVTEAIKQAAAVKLYIGNLMTQPGETMGFSASQHVEAIARHTGLPALFPHVLLNSQPFSDRLLKRYLEEGACPVETDTAALKKMGLAIHERELAHEGEKLRHDSTRLAEAVLEIFDKETAR
ncbi:MAG: YvcK family protein [Acidobacteria bacterium]|nr:MAG: YvcK family protein [Acidobacteriota bacterium]